MPQVVSLFKSATLLTFFILGFSALQAEDIKRAIQKTIASRSSEYIELAHRIWELAELGYLEHQSSALLKGKAEAAGFKIESGVADIPTAFVASYGKGKPVIGIMAEFDALPGLSQKATTKRDPRIEGKAGHACGHHLFGTASLAAALAIKDQIASGNLKGTIRLYGTPAEEGGSGKV
ncbi:MAG: amidohydrolase, partial [Verrucomicrobia bacterium]|nr:amidohydrolase [Verrucomicrobiota bacterium]